MIERGRGDFSVHTTSVLARHSLLGTDRLVETLSTGVKDQAFLHMARRR